MPNYTTTPSLLLQQPGPRLLSFDTFILELSLEFQFILVYRWTFQSERQLVMGSLLFTELRMLALLSSGCSL